MPAPRLGGSPGEPPRRVLVFCAHFHPSVGGVERYTLELFGRLAARGWRVTVVTGNTDGAAENDMVGPLAVTRLPVVQVIDDRVPVLVPDRAIVKAAAALRAWAPQAIVTQTRFFSTSVLGAILAKRWRVPRLHIEHGSEHVGLGSRLGDRFSQLVDHTVGAWVVRTADRCAGVSSAAAAFVGHLGRPGAGVLHNGVDCDGFARAPFDWRAQHGIPATDRVVLCVTRLIEDKGVRSLMDAFDALGPPTRSHLVVAGEGPLLRELEARATGRSDVHLLGRISPAEVVAVLHAADVFVHPSACPEGLPTAVLEAAAAGLAIVATGVGGTREVVPSDAHGRIVPAKDRNALTRALAPLLADPELRVTLGQNVQQHVRHAFDWERITDAAEGELDRLMSPDRAGPGVAARHISR